MNNIVFIGDWTKDRVLGSGSFGIVVLWKHKRSDEKLAIKFCKWGDELTVKHKERWSKEVEMMQDFNHPNIVGTKELPAEFVAGLRPANPSGLPVLCMEYCNGGDLRQLLNKPESCTGLKEQQVRQILGDIRSAMHFLHLNKITHRDLKPENIVLHIQDHSQNNIGTQTQPKVTYKLIDLGYAKEIDSNSICASFVGTMQYLAPELHYSKTYSNSVDYWSLGLLAFEIICGKRPFLPFMSLVQWMPLVKRKTHEHICIYEPFHEGDDVEYSNEIFPENHISKAFKTLMEKWLRVALEWDPKLRGRDATSKVTFNIPTEQQRAASKVVIFDLLESILATKIIKLFSVSTLSNLSYVIDDTTTISTLKSWISRDVNIPVSDQVLVSQSTYLDIGNEELVSRYWNPNTNFMIFLFKKGYIIDSKIEAVVPKSVKRILAQYNVLYNFKNSQNLYRHGVYLVMYQMELYDGLINGLFTRAESLKNESKLLLLKHNEVDKSIGKLITQEETIMKIVKTGKKHIQNMRDNGTATNYLGGFQQLFDKADDLSDQIRKLQTAAGQVFVRLQSVSRRCNEVSSVHLNNFVAKHNYAALFTDAITTYVKYKRSEYLSEHRITDKKCTDIMVICYNCLKFRGQLIDVMQDNEQMTTKQPFIVNLIHVSVEMAKISEIIANTALTVEKMESKIGKLTDDLTKCIWATLSILASDADNVADLPYSVVSFQKRDFKIGEPVSITPSMKVVNCMGDDEQIKSLIQESIKIRSNHMSLSEKLNEQTKMISSSNFDFSFLND